MNSIIHAFKQVDLDELYIVEVGQGSALNRNYLYPNASMILDTDIGAYKQIEANFFSFDKTDKKYIWGNGIEAMWDELDETRTCYFPWDRKIDSWNIARFERPSIISKIEFCSLLNSTRNVGVKFQASVDGEEWDTLYQLKSIDIVRLKNGYLDIYLRNSRKRYLYIRIIHEDSDRGYDFNYIRCYKKFDHNQAIRDYYTLHFIMSGTLNVNNITVKAPFAILTTPQNSPVAYQISSAEEEYSDFWISFDGKIAEKLLLRANINTNESIIGISDISMLEKLRDKIFSNIEHALSDDQFIYISVLFEILSCLLENPIAQNEGSVSVQDSYVISAIQYIDKNYKSNINVDDLSRHISISNKYLIKIFKEKTGKTPLQYIMNKRNDEAKKLLVTADCSISYIADELGYSSPEYFCRAFKKSNGMVPSAYRKKRQSDFLEKKK